MIRRARHYLETDESPLETVMRDREERTAVAPYCTSFLWIKRMRLWQRGLRFISGTTRIVLRCFRYRLAIRRSNSFASRFISPHPFLIARAFAHVSFFSSRVFVSLLKVKRV